jgi:paraquat-inducible protein A
MSEQATIQWDPAVSSPGLPSACETCGLIVEIPEPAPRMVAACPRCGNILAQHKPNSVQRTLCFALAALLFYIPANLLPIMSFDYYGAIEHNTIWSGIKSLAEAGSLLVAVVVFFASMVIPLVKLSILFFLTLSVKMKRGRKIRTHLYRLIQLVGSWAMLDVFLVGILVSLVKLGQLATVRPGPAAVPFCLVVVLTLLATESFDPRLLWSSDERIAESDSAS